MIFKTASPISPDVNITIDATPVNYLALQRIVLDRGENKHDLLVLDFSGVSANVLHDYVNKPLKVSIQFPNIGGTEFVGYIVFVEPTAVTKDGLVNQSPIQMSRVYCFGSSYKMREKKNKAWQNVTFNDVVKVIANNYRFAINVPKNTYRFTRLIQSNKSDWEFLAMLSETLGYSINMDGTTIHAWDPYQSLGRKISYSVLRTMVGMKGDPSALPGQVLRFDATIGAVTPYQERNSEMVTLLERTGNVLSISNDLEQFSGMGEVVNSQFSHESAFNADSVEMASVLLQGRLRKKFPMEASVEITGNPTIKPGGVIRLDKYDSKFDGFWYVSNVRHIITKSELVSQLHLKKDALDADNIVMNPTKEYEATVATSLINGEWVSERESVVEYT